MSTLNYATQYQAALAQAYPNVLHFAALRSTENDSRYRWVDGQTIKIPTLTTTGRTDASRDTIGTASRNFDNDWETKSLGNHRKWGTLVHPMDVDETNQVASIQNITQTFNEEQKFPEMDAYLVSKLYADWTAAGKTADTTVITEKNILSIFDGYMEAMNEQNVPVNGRWMFMTPAVKRLLHAAISRTVGNGEASIVRTVETLDKVQIEEVPSQLMKTVYDFTVGFKPGASAKQINLLLVHPSAVITPEKYAFAKLDPPSAGSEGKYVYFEESYEDTFLLNQRKHAVAFNIT